MIRAYGLLALEAPRNVLVPRLLARFDQAPRHRLFHRRIARVALHRDVHLNTTSNILTPVIFLHFTSLWQYRHCIILYLKFIGTSLERAYGALAEVVAVANEGSVRGIDRLGEKNFVKLFVNNFIYF